MKLSSIFLAAASSAALVAALGADAGAADLLDANGRPCVNGVLDSAHQCMSKDATTSTAEHPYRDVQGLKGLKIDQYHSELFLPDGRANAHGASGLGGFGGRHLVFAAVPGSIVVMDPSKKYNFVKRIVFEEKPAGRRLESIAGMMASPATNMVYVSTRGHLVAIDLDTDKVAWSKEYEPGTCCERGQVTPDGLTLEVGSNLQDFHRVIDARTGDVKGIIQTPQSMFNHNMNMSPDGKLVFDAPNGITMTVASMDTMKAIKTITFSDHIRVFVINHDATRIYAGLNNLLGFEIADVKTGKVIKRIEAPAEMWKAKWADPNQHFYGHGAPMHGIAMTPDESEIWLPDAVNNQVLVYDNPLDGGWPTLNLKKSFKTNGEPNGWITMGFDGKFAFMASGDVVDVKTHKIVAQMKDEYGRYMDSEKVLDMEYDADGKLIRTVNQFSIGDPGAYAARVARAKGAKSASN
jgi:DNA-binding beta-propeller fold protein YncE